MSGPRRRTPRTGQHLRLEHLERRCLLTGTATLHSQVLDIAGDGSANVISVVLDPVDARVRVVIDGVDAHPDGFAIARVQSVRIDGLDGNDRIDIDEAIAVGSQIFCGAGDDTVCGGSGNDTVDAGAGNDSIMGRRGDDLLIGGADSDLLRGGAGNDCLRGGDGPDDLRGGTGSDTLRGGEDADTLFGNAGDDSIDAGAGNDLVEGGDGNDTGSGDAGDDTLHGGHDNDQLAGGRENATRFRPDEVNSLRGDDGNDTLAGGDADDLLEGGAGNDLILGRAGDDTADGGTGDDSISGQQGDDILFGSLGEDTIVGGRGGDILDGGTGGDSLDGSTADDILIGGLGNDTVTGGRGGDLFAPLQAGDSRTDFASGSDSDAGDAVVTGTFSDPGLLGDRTDLLAGAPDVNIRTHVTGSIDYSGHTNPPSYGPHHPSPLFSGIYLSEQADADLVHNLEHGHVWISYNPALLDASDILRLQYLVAAFGAGKGIVLTPRSGNATAIALVSWAHLEQLTSLDLTEAREFILTNRGHAPEGFAIP